MSGIAGRYASALFELADQANSVEAVGRDLAAFDRMIGESADLERLVRSPVFTAEEQVASVSAILGAMGITGLAANFLKLVASKRRLFAVRDMAKSYAALADRKAGISRAEVTVAASLSPDHRAAVTDALAGITGGSVQIVERVDPSIIGGLIVKLGSKMVDASVRTKLNSLKIAMNEVR